MAKDQTSIAVIGAGRIALMHAAIIRHSPGMVLAGIVDRRGRAEMLRAAGLGGIRVYASAEEAFADDAADAVLIASSTPTHCAFVGAAAAAGKHILCEKPVALCAADITRLAKDTAECGRVIQVGFNRRFDDDYRTLRARFGGGEVGDAVLIHITNHDPQCPPPAFAKTAGGIFADFNSHDFDMLRFLTGARIVSIHARGGAKVCGGGGGADTTLISMELTGGIFASIHCCRQSGRGYDQRAEILGKKGMLFLSNRRDDAVRIANNNGETMANPPPNFAARYKASYHHQLDAFVRACRGEDAEAESIGATLADAAEAMRVAEAAEQSLTSGQAITLPR